MFDQILNQITYHLTDSRREMDNLNVESQERIANIFQDRLTEWLQGDKDGNIINELMHAIYDFKEMVQLESEVKDK
jgi:hypothetical protein